MKKFLSLFILTAMVLTLAACSGGSGGSAASAQKAPDPTATPDMTDILTASGTNATAKMPPASGTDTQTGDVPQADAPQSGTVTPLDQEAYEKAQACIGQDVQQLYSAIGQPAETPTYGPSCLIQGAEDGMLYYTGFYVWTIRTSTGETVHEVYPDA